MPPSLHRRDFLRVAASAPLALGATLGSENVSAAESSTRLPLIVLFLSGGVASKESFNPDPPSVSEDLRGPLASIPTATPGIHFSEVFSQLARRADQFALLRGLDSGSSDHTPSQQAAVLSGSKTVSEIVGEKSANGGVPYVFLNPGSTWDGITLAFRKQQAFTPLWDSQAKRFNPPEMAPVDNLAERRKLLEAFDRGVPGPAAQRAQKFRETAFDLLMGGGKFFSALDLPEKDRARYGSSLSGDMVLMAKRFIERGAGAVTVYHEPEPVAYDLHNNIGPGMRKLAPEMDHAAAVLLDEITSHRLNAVLLLMGEFNRTPKVNGTAGRDHWPYGNAAILAGGKVREGAVHGKTDKLGRITDGEVKQKEALTNTVLVACNEEISPEKPRAREILR